MFSSTSEGPPQNPYYRLVELNDENVYKVTCPKGHVTYISLQQQRFEILADISIWAFGLDLPDLAVIRSYSSLEVFETYFVECALYHSGQEKIAIDRIKKDLVLAERRRGAFLISFRSASEKYPASAPKLPEFDSLVKLRNQIVHGGRLVSTEEARIYCQGVFDFIVDTINWMRENMADAMSKCTVSHVKDNKDRIPPDADFSFVAIPTIVSLSLVDLEKIPIDDAFRELLASRNFVRPDLLM